MNWSDLKLKHFQELVKLPINQMEELDMMGQIKLLNKIYTIINGQSKLLGADELFTLSQEYEFLTRFPEDVTFQFEHEGVKYGMDGDIKNWKTVQFLTMHDTVNAKTNDEVIEKMADLLAIFIRPFKNETELVDLDVSKFDEYRDIFKEHMPADVAYSASIFFLILSHELQIHMIQSSVDLAMESLQPQVDSLTNNTDSTPLP